MNLITQRGKITRNGQRSRATSDEGYFFASGYKWTLRHKCCHIAFVVSSNPFKTANCDGFFFHTPASAGGFAGAVAGATQYTRKYIRFPVDHVRFCIAFSRNQSDVFGYRGMRRARVLTVHHFVEIFGVFDVSRFQGGMV